MIEQDLTPEIVAYAVPPLDHDGKRCLPALFRIRRIGKVYFVEQLHLERHLDADDKEVVSERWKSAAVAKSTQKEPNARMEAFQWMHAANMEAIRLSVA